MTADRDWTYAEVDAAPRRMAAGLLFLGVRRRDHVAMIMANCPGTSSSGSPSRSSARWPYRSATR